MTTLHDLNLRVNPFRDITPAITAEPMIWAEMHEVKEKIERAYKDCITNNSKQLVLNWGAYGGGKTFSARYFMNEKGRADNVQHIYVQCPKDGSTATDEFFRSIIDFLSFDTIQQQIRILISKMGDNGFMDFLTPVTGREFAKAISLIGSENDEVSDLMNRFLYSGLTKNEIKKLGIAKDIRTDSDTIKFLAGVFSCFIGDGSLYNGRVVFWIDEMEDLIYYSSKHYKTFSQLIRDLFDSISNGFLTFMNFTLAEGEESTIELILGGAVWSRVTKKIRYKQFSIEDAFAYALELLNYSKIDKSNNSPIGEDAIRAVLSGIAQNSLTPREVNKHMRALISFAMERDVKVVDLDFVKLWSKEYGEDS